MDPPPPIRPSETPIKIAPRYPIISITAKLLIKGRFNGD